MSSTRKIACITFKIKNLLQIVTCTQWVNASASISFWSAIEKHRNFSLKSRIQVHLIKNPAASCWVSDIQKTKDDGFAKMGVEYIRRDSKYAHEFDSWLA